MITGECGRLSVAVKFLQEFLFVAVASDAFGLFVSFGVGLSAVL